MRRECAVDGYLDVSIFFLNMSIFLNMVSYQIQTLLKAQITRTGKNVTHRVGVLTVHSTKHSRNVRVDYLSTSRCILDHDDDPFNILNFDHALR